jgi:hypothetical protein
MFTELWVYFNFRKRPPVNRASQFALRDLEPAEPETVNGSCNSQLALFKTMRQCELRPALAFFETLLKAYVSVN